jgi:hypothetical protein
VRREREVIVCKEEGDFSQCILVKIIYAINSALENNEVITAYYL